MSGEKLDAIIFGANEFMGEFVVEEALEILKDIKWGISGGNEKELKAVLRNLGNRLDQDLKHIPIIISDVNDPKSIERMAKRCKLVLNCCGPHHLYGEAIVKACIEVGTHHLDITGEPQYNSTGLLKYHELAEKNGSYVIPIGGWETIPAEIGVLYAQKKYPGLLNSIELYWEAKLYYQDITAKSILPSKIWRNIIYYIQYSKELMSFQKKLKNENDIAIEPKLKLISGIHKTEGLDSYFIAMPTAARYWVQRSQSLFQQSEEKRPIQFGTYIGFKSFYWALFLPILMLFYSIMSKFNLTRQLLLLYPSIFANGYITHQEPVEANRKSIEFIYTLKAKGWYKSNPESPDPIAEMHVRVLAARDNYYGLPCKALLLCGKIILQEQDKMPGSGGVLPPAFAFAKTNLLEEICGGNYGLKLEIV